MATAINPMRATDFTKVREAWGLTQAEMAAHLGVHFTTVNKWETGARSVPGSVPLALEALAVRIGQRLPRWRTIAKAARTAKTAKTARRRGR
jgi:DNA-binding XRE family transcriptional regulator